MATLSVSVLHSSIKEVTYITSIRGEREVWLQSGKELGTAALCGKR